MCGSRGRKVRRGLGGPGIELVGVDAPLSEPAVLAYDRKIDGKRMYRLKLELDP